jgi:hypothetical protein
MQLFGIWNDKTKAERESIWKCRRLSAEHQGGFEVCDCGRPSNRVKRLDTSIKRSSNVRRGIPKLLVCSLFSLPLYFPISIFPISETIWKTKLTCVYHPCCSESGRCWNERNCCLPMESRKSAYPLTSLLLLPAHTSSLSFFFFTAEILFTLSKITLLLEGFYEKGRVKWGEARMDFCTPLYPTRLSRIFRAFQIRNDECV